MVGPSGIAEHTGLPDVDNIVVDFAVTIYLRYSPALVSSERGRDSSQL